jgi:outer membrane lipoprotein-sorting protein
MKMTRPVTALFALLTCLTLTTPACLAADAPGGGGSIDAILSRHVEAIGGRAAIEKITSRVLRGSFAGFGMTTPADWTMYAKAPNKVASDMELPGLGRMLDGFDGQVAWSKNPFTGLRLKEGQELAKQKRDADFYRDLHTRTTYTNLTLKGTEKVAGADATVLEARPTPDTIERMYFDPKSGLMVRQDSEFNLAEGRVKLQIAFSDHREVSGIRYAHLMNFTITLPEQPAAEFSIRVKEIKVNENIDDAKFAKPAE